MESRNKRTLENTQFPEETKTKKQNDWIFLEASCKVWRKSQINDSESQKWIE
jgi:hypothetical protein